MALTPFGAGFAVPQALQRLQVATLSRRERGAPCGVALVRTSPRSI